MFCFSAFWGFAGKPSVNTCSKCACSCCSLTEFQMKIYVNIYEDSTSLKLQVWLRSSVEYIYFSKIQIHKPFSLCPVSPHFCFLFYISICSSVIFSSFKKRTDIVIDVLFLLQVWLYAILGYFTTYYLSGIWHNWSVQLNNVHMKERQISKKRKKKRTEVSENCSVNF